MASASSPRTAAPVHPLAFRRRGRTLECAIVEAVLGLLREGGYEAVTMEGVADRARTGKAALYRRWDSRAHLVADVIARCLPRMDDIPDRGSVRDELIEVLGRLAEFVNSPTGCVVSTMASNRETDIAFRNLIAARLVEPQLRIMGDVLQRGVARGEVRPDVRLELVCDVGPSLLLKRYLADHVPITEDYVVAIVDELLMPVLR